MTTDPFFSNEVVVQLIQDRKTASYVAMSAAIMFVWDYGALTNH
jgi:hypothetical protein